MSFIWNEKILTFANLQHFLSFSRTCKFGQNPLRASKT